MSESIELHDSDISSVELSEGIICIVLSDAYIWADKKGWSQTAFLSLEYGEILEKPDNYPLTISRGTLNSNKEQFDNILPLPFSERGRFTVKMTFTNGDRLKLKGDNPTIKLVGERHFIENAGDL